MIATKDSLEPQSSERLPNSERILRQGGVVHADVRVPFREIKLSDTLAYDGRVEANAPVRVDDCSGPWGDPAFSGDVIAGLTLGCAKMDQRAGGVEEYDGREVKPMDNGYLSAQITRNTRARRNGTSCCNFRG